MSSLTAREAIATLNHHKLLLPLDQTAGLARVIACAAARNDVEAINFLWLVNWKPQQSVN